MKHLDIDPLIVVGAGNGELANALLCEKNLHTDPESTADQQRAINCNLAFEYQVGVE